MRFSEIGTISGRDADLSVTVCRCRGFSPTAEEILLGSTCPASFRMDLPNPKGVDHLASPSRRPSHKLANVWSRITSALHKRDFMGLWKLPIIPADRGRLHFFFTLLDPDAATPFRGARAIPKRHWKSAAGRLDQIRPIPPDVQRFFDLKRAPFEGRKGFFPELADAPTAFILRITRAPVSPPPDNAGGI